MGSFKACEALGGGCQACWGVLRHWHTGYCEDTLINTGYTANIDHVVRIEDGVPRGNPKPDGASIRRLGDQAESPTVD